jgi:hypothetical protein
VFSKKHLLKKEYQPGMDDSEDEGWEEKQQDEDRGRNAATGSNKSSEKKAREGLRRKIQLR